MFIKRKAISKAVRHTLYVRDNFKCCKCDATENLTVDHVVPRLLGGENHLNNYQTLCEPCNVDKGSNMAVYSDIKANHIYLEKFLVARRYIKSEMLKRKLIKKQELLMWKHKIAEELSFMLNQRDFYDTTYGY